MSTGSSDRRSSQVTVTFQDDTNPLLFTNAHFYGALFEFCPGTEPYTIWEYGRAGVSDYNEFKMFIVNAQAPFAPLSTTNPEPTVVQSTYENMHYVAIYTFVLDVEAKNLKRPIVFIISNINPEIINHVYHLYNKEFIQHIKSLKQLAEKDFPDSLSKYAASLLKAIEKYPKEQTNLKNKYAEIKELLNYYKIKDLDVENAATKPPEYFLLLHNDLNPLESLINLNEITALLDKFISDIPTTLLCSSIAAHADISEYDPQLQFGGVDRIHGYSNLAFKMFSRNFTDDRYTIRGFVSNNIFHHCAYTLLSGRTLIINSYNTHIALSLAKKFVILIPFFRQEYLCVTDEVNSISYLQYAIVITKNVVNPNQFERMVSILDLDKNKYKGIECPQTSLVFSRFAKLISVSERAFLLSLYTELKKVATDFIVVVYLNVAHVEKTPEKIFQSLKDRGLSKDDEPIFEFWLNSFFNKQKIKPIMRKLANGPTIVIDF